MTIKLYGMSIINLVFWLTFSVTGTEWKFDFGSNSSPAANGWIRISERDLYSPEKGYGWQAKWAYPGSYDKVNEPDLKTFLGTSANTTEALFQMDVPNGAYLVTVRLGSTMPSEGRDGQCVSINGHQVLPPPGVGGWGKLVTRILPAVAENGVLKIRFYTPT